MNWDDKSDDEVSVNLAKSLGLCVHNVKGEWLKYTGVSKGLPTYEKPDYCNSWADIGPLMLKFDVYILPTSNDCEFNYLAKTLIDGSIGMGWTTKYTSFNNNPLRAAATCLIKKLEAENESILTTG